MELKEEEHKPHQPQECQLQADKQQEHHFQDNKR